MKVAYISDIHIDSWIKTRDEKQSIELDSEFFYFLEFLFGTLDILYHKVEDIRQKHSYKNH